MKKTTIRRLLDVPGARVSLPPDGLQVDGKPAGVPWFPGTLEVGVLLAMPRPGLPLVIEEKDFVAFGRFIGPAIFDTFEKVSTLRKFLGLPEVEAGTYVTTVEKDSEGVAREVVAALRKMKKEPNWRSWFSNGIANGAQDALANGITIGGGASDWAKAIVEAVEAVETQEKPVTQISDAPTAKARR